MYPRDEFDTSGVKSDSAYNLPIRGSYGVEQTCSYTLEMYVLGCNVFFSALLWSFKQIHRDVFVDTCKMLFAQTHILSLLFTYSPISTDSRNHDWYGKIPGGGDGSFSTVRIGTRR